jgi:hypothetical protein
LNNDGTGVEVKFTPVITNRVKVTATTVSGTTTSVGLAEVIIYGGPPTGGNLAPIANAGPDQSVAGGSAVLLDGRNSSDPNGDKIVSYQWTQTAGPTLVILGANTSTPSFSAPSNLTATTVVTIALIVNDGLLNSPADSMSVTITPQTSTSTNIAALATVTASSQNTKTGQQATKAIDGIIDGWPGDSSREWATIGKKVGAWIQLQWKTSHRIDRVVLYDRPNTADQITSATLTFSDGSTVAVGSLSNTGSGVVVNFAPVVTTSVKLTVKSVSSSTQNVGLAEMQVFGL